MQAKKIKLLTNKLLEAEKFNAIAMTSKNGIQRGRNANIHESASKRSNSGASPRLNSSPKR